MRVCDAGEITEERVSIIPTSQEAIAQAGAESSHFFARTAPIILWVIEHQKCS